MIAVVAGTGALPGLIVAALQSRGDVPVVCALRGFDPVVPDGCPRVAFRIETLGSLLQTLRAMAVTRVVMAGAISRPQADPAAIDAATAPLVPRLMAAMARGDDGALREVIAIFEEAGFDVVGAHDLVPDLLPPFGVLTRAKPGDDVSGMVQAALVALDGMAAADVGQACVVTPHGVIAREAQDGTDAMLARLAVPFVDTAPATSDPFSFVMDVAGDALGAAAKWLSGVDAPARPAAGGILFKAPKPTQDRRADLPVIGPATAIAAARAGLSGIVIEAGGVMVIDLPQVVSLLDAKGLFLWVRTP